MLHTPFSFLSSSDFPTFLLRYFVMPRYPPPECPLPGRLRGSTRRVDNRKSYMSRTFFKNTAYFVKNRRKLITLRTGGERIVANAVDGHPPRVALVGSDDFNPFSANLERAQSDFKQVAGLQLQGLGF